MKIFILDSEKITDFTLPEEISEMFLIPYVGLTKKRENYLSVEAIDGKWVAKSNGNINIVNGNNIISSIVLDNYNEFTLYVNGENELIKMYILPSFDNNTQEVSLTDLSNVISLKNITIGNNAKNNIIYQNNLLDKYDVSIKFQDNFWYIVSSNNSFVYLNKTRVLTSKLFLGDVIFINGIKIIWMNCFFKINNPNNLLKINGLNLYNNPNLGLNTNFINTNIEDDCNINDNDYFFHTPTLKPTIEKEVVNIDAPPENQIQEEMPFILTLGSSITLASSSLVSGLTVYTSLSSGQRTVKDCLPQIIMCGTMLFGCLVMPRIISLYQKQMGKKKERKRQRKYKKYLDKKEEQILAIMERQSQILTQTNQSIIECQKMIVNNDREIWSREIVDKNFLNLRLGLGDADVAIDIKAPEEHFTLDEDNLQEMVFDVVNKSRKLENVPVTVNLVEKDVTAVISQCNYEQDFLNGILLQLITHHSGEDLKIVFFTDQDGLRKWNYVKCLSHCWSDDKTLRFFATTTEEYNDVSTYLENEVKKRKALLKNNESEEEIDQTMGYKNYSPYYLIINDNYKKNKDIQIIDTILNSKDNLGFSMLIVDNSMINIPNKCKTFIQINNIDGCISEKEINSQTQHKFKPEFDSNIDMNYLAEKIANIPLMSKDVMNSLPKILSFLEMFNVSKIEQLNIMNRWKDNNPTINLQTPVGVHVNGELFKLDLHEKFHGPHGLVAGSTGSGKSEFIITYVLSMAINYDPKEVQFVLIDYKGGGLAGAFENKDTGVKLPHLAGTITNLDKSEINRTLVSIQSELKRRQRVFNEVKDSLGESTMDIYKYQRLYREGSIEEPISHLFIVSDEFAELKSQQPEFMDELISTARIGRSLGVHLILATQKPSGVVNDQIWSNSKFKVCLKVQDRADSMEMLKRPEAASIKETGRFYLQVGYDDYFDIGQSAWAGAKYIPSDRVIKKVDDSLSYINNIGYAIKSINDIQKKEVSSVEMGDQLTNIVKYLSDISKKQNFVAQKMWLDSIPEIIYISDLKKKYPNFNTKPYYINPIIGEYDNPKNQEQGVLSLDLVKNGNILIYGQTGSGKENLLTTLILSIIMDHTPQEVSIYIMDFGAEVLKVLARFPHVGDIVLIDELEKMLTLLSMAEEEIDRRKDLFSDFGGSYYDYNENNENKEPLFIVVLNNYDAFSETYSKYTEYLQPMFRDGYKYGVIFILSTSTLNGVRQRSAQNFKYKIALKLPNDTDYRVVLNSPKGLVPNNYYGRGIFSDGEVSYEFQTALICERKNINLTIKQASDKLISYYKGYKVKRIPVLPDKVTVNFVSSAITNVSSFILGISDKTKDFLKFDLTYNNINLIISNDISLSKNFVSAFIKQLKIIGDYNIKIVDFINYDLSIEKGIFYTKDNYDEFILNIYRDLVNSANNKDFYIFIGLGEFKNKLSNDGIKYLNAFMDNISKFKNKISLIIDNNTSFKKLELESWYNQKVDSARGIWLGTGVGSQLTLKINNLSIDDRKTEFEDMAFVVKNGEYEIIKYIIDDEENTNE